MSSAATGVLRRALHNTSLLLTGKGAAGAMQLATLALIADGLDLEAFGLFSMLSALGLVVVGVAAFESNQAIVRYGVLHLRTGDRAAFQRLVKAGLLLDATAAALAGLAIVVLAPWAGRLADWDAATVADARWLAPLALMSLMATPKGMLRLFDRFDLLSAQFGAAPAVRLAGTILVWLADGDVRSYLGAWLVGVVTGVAVALFLGFREARRHGLLEGFEPGLAHLSRDNPGVWRFALATNLNASITLLPSHVATFLIGVWLTPAAAGLFRVARDVGGALAKPVELMKQALLPDIARMVTSGQWRRVRQAAVRAGGLAAAVGAALTLLVSFAGANLLALLFGDPYAAAAPLLVAMSAATSMRASALAADPILYALGRPGLPLAVTLAANVAFLAVLAWRVPADGLSGAIMAFVALSVVGASLSIAAADRAMRQAASA